MKLWRKEKQVEIVHRGIQIVGEPKFYWGMLFEPRNTQPHLRYPPKAVLRCLGSSDPIEFANETTNRTQPMMEAWDGNLRHLGIVPDLILMSSDEEVFRSLMEAREADLRERGFAIRACPSSWGYGWHCLEPRGIS